MSKNYVKAVLDYVPLTNPTDVSVLVALAEYTSDETRLAWPSVASLARRTRLHRVTVQHALRRLEALELISTTLGGQDDDGRNTSSCYRLEFDHRGERLIEVKIPPKRVLAPAVVTRDPAGRLLTHAAVSAQLKKVPASQDYAPRDLSAEKQRQLAALRKIKT